jgi:NAD(P)-dependent dehydrogenase (short-subunit alcohol dehydrogenase family)
MAATLSGKSALVTGGAGGFGLSCAMALARDGAAVTLMGRKAPSLDAAKAKIAAAYPEARVALYAGDGTKDEDVRAAIKTAVDTHGSLDIVVSTVGAGMAKSVTESTGAEFMAAVSYNVLPGFLAIHEALPFMPNGGSFVFISSTAAAIPFDGMAGYCAGKAGLDHMIRAAAHELGPRGFRFNCVRPGLTRTSATVGLFANDALMARFVERIPLGRAGEPEEIAEAVRFLAGPESSWTTGQSFAIDGGNELRGAPYMGTR